MSTVQTLYDNIDKMAAENDLAAVLIHFNDTYILEERESGLPGMARIATLIQRVRTRVKYLCGEDRTLALHSGDFLMPSRLGKKTEGQSMTRMLAQCVNVLTLGNHEFDLNQAVLADRLTELRNAGVHLVCSNVHFSRTQIRGVEELVYWPSAARALFAITGLMSETVASKAKEWRADVEPPMIALEELINKVRQRGASRLIVLSHADRNDDLEFLRLLDRIVDGNPGFAYLLGGHDHDVNWSQVNPTGPTGNAVLSKSLSNCRSLRIFLVSRSQLLVDEIRCLVESNGAIGNTWKNERLAKSQKNKSLGEQGERVLRQLQTGMRKSDVLAALKSEEIGCDVGIRLQAAELSQIPAEKEFTRMVENETDRGKRLDKENSGAERPHKDLHVDLRDRVQSIDVRDSQMRHRPMPFGKFVAECVRIGTAADYALIHSGSFRGDDKYLAVLNKQLLEDVFIYDDPTAIIVVDLDQKHVDAIVNHGEQESMKGNGAYPQCSPDKPPSNKGCLKIAIPSFILENDLDGYQGALLRSTGLSKDELKMEMDTWKKQSCSIIEKVTDNANQCIHLLCTEPPSDKNPQEDLLLDGFKSACAKAVQYDNANLGRLNYTEIRNALNRGSGSALLGWHESDEYSRQTFKSIDDMPPDLIAAFDPVLKWATNSRDARESMHGIRRTLSARGEHVEAEIAEAIDNYPLLRPAGTASSGSSPRTAAERRFLILGHGSAAPPP